MLYYPVPATPGAGAGVGSSASVEGLKKENQMLKERLEDLQRQLEMLKKKSAPEQPSGAQGPASLTVRLPADASLYIDNTKCPLTSGTRTFSTPALETGRQYFYMLRADVVRNGQVLTQSQKVLVQAGQQVTVEFSSFAPGTATVQR